MRGAATLRRAIRTALAAAMLAASLPGCSPAATRVNAREAVERRPELRVSAATSLKRVLERVAPDFERRHGVTLVFNFGASGQLQRQIEAGAPADVFVSASPDQVDSLIAGGFVSTEATSTFAGNDIVVFVPRGEPAGIRGPEGLANVERITTGDPATAPHGAKVREWLTRLGMWDDLVSRFVFAENAAQTLDYVARGEVDAGIGFASEAKGNGEVEIVYTVPRGAITPVAYVAAPLKGSAHAATAAAFVAWLSGSAVQRELASEGLLPAASL